MENQKCPLCEYSLNLHSEIKGKAVEPQPGDLSICLSCHSVLTFGDNLMLRALTKEEMQALEADADFWNEIVGVIHTMRNLPRAN